MRLGAMVDCRPGSSFSVVHVDNTKTSRSLWLFWKKPLAISMPWILLVCNWTRQRHTSWRLNVAVTHDENGVFEEKRQPAKAS